MVYFFVQYLSSKGQWLTAKVYADSADEARGIALNADFVKCVTTVKYGGKIEEYHPITL